MKIIKMRNMPNTPIEFTNRRGNIYYVKSKLTKKGNTTYYMTKKKDEDCLNSLPDKYEVFEKPDTGVLYIRQKKEKMFDAKEIGFVEKALEKNKEVIDFRLDVVGNMIKIYVGDKQTFDERMSTWENRPLFRNRAINFIKSSMRLGERMRIIKSKNGEYEFQRYCYRGSIDDWIWIDGGEDLQDLVKTNIHHLGRMSYYEL